MAHIQATDRNLSNLEPMEELTEGELLAIQGGIPAAWAPSGQYPSAWSQYSSPWYRPRGRGIPAVISWWL